MAGAVQPELAKWLARKTGEDQADQVIAFTQTRTVGGLLTCDWPFEGLPGIQFVGNPQN